MSSNVDYVIISHICIALWDSLKGYLATDMTSELGGDNDKIPPDHSM